MRTVIILLSAAIWFSTGCKDKPKAAPATGSGSQKVATGSGSAGSAQPKQNELILPPLTNTPPIKTTKPLDTAKSKEVTEKLEFGGFTKDIRRADDNGIDVRYKTTERPRIAVTINATKCFDCLPMELEKWTPKADSLRVLVGPELQNLPDTTFDFGATDVGGTTVMFSYHVGYSIKPGETGTGGAYANAYALYFNDGVNMIRVVAEYKDDVPATREDMLNLVPREDLERVAKAFFDAYVHAWG
ncbi:MAG: hypothetical protein H0T89_33765 [Deltaproteobacteria bacterium]|nr:hypothetical protein [Deltaproteobacteria bacterium]